MRFKNTKRLTVSHTLSDSPDKKNAHKITNSKHHHIALGLPFGGLSAALVTPPL